MADAIDVLLGELAAAASSLRVQAAALLPYDAMRRVEVRAAQVAAALLDGEGLQEDGTDELLSVDTEAAAVSGEPERLIAATPAPPPRAIAEPEFDDSGEGFDDESATLVGPAAAAVAAAAVAAAAVLEESELPAIDEYDDSAMTIVDDEDVFDEATFIEGDDDTVPLESARQGVAWDEVQTFVAEDTGEVPLEYAVPSGDDASHIMEVLGDDDVSFIEEEELPVASTDEVSYVVETAAASSGTDEVQYVTEAPIGDLEDDGADDPSDAGLVSFNDEDQSYISYDDEVLVDEEEATVPVVDIKPVVDSQSYVSFDEVPVGEVSDADLALGDDAAFDEDEEVTLGSIPVPPSHAVLSRDDMSDIGEDALVTLEEDGDVLSGLDDEAGETFDLMGGAHEDEILLEEDDVTLTGIDDTDGDDDEIMVDDARGGGAPPVVNPPRVAAANPRVTAGLYGNPAVPTIREGNDPVPKAAAVQLNAGGGGGRMIGLEEEEEPIELGSVGDFGEDEDEYENEGDGLSLAIQEYEEEEEEEEEEIEIEPEPVAPPPPRGPSAAEVQAIFERAQAAANNGALQEAADLYSDVVDADPDHLDAHVGRGRLYLDLGDYSRAMSDFMVAEEIDDNSPEPQVAIGDLYFHRKDYRKAIEYFDTALKMSPNHAMAFCRRGISHYYRKNYKEALRDLEKANSLDADIPNIASFISMAKRKAKAAPARR